MKVYVEEIEDLSTHGVTRYSLVRGMEFFYADVRASGIEIEDSDGADVYEYDDTLGDELKEALFKEIYKEK